jgi:AcrR family transcriptional regulator
VVIRQRAVLAQEKEERHDAILDAAERLLRRDPDRIPSVAEVAEEAGLAKGTVYLYFPGKEELLMALHERNVGAFFEALIARLDSVAPLTIAEILTVVRRQMIEPPLFLPLASRCFGVMQQAAGVEAARAFKERMANRLQRAGAGLERHFNGLEPGDGVHLLRHSYALVLGLWQMSPSSKTRAASIRSADSAPAVPLSSVHDDLDRALVALWRGTLAPSALESGR